MQYQRLACNDNGLKLISFAIEKKMKTMSTHFKKKNICKGTWVILDRNKTNQIDHVLIQEKYAKMIANMRTCRRADANSNHLLEVQNQSREEINRRTTLRIRMLQTATEENQKSYQHQMKKVKQIRKNYTKKKREQLENKYKNKEIRNFYKEIKNIKKGYQSRPTHYRDKVGNLIGDETEKLKRFLEYFKEMLSKRAKEYEE
ncbi:hypothetical protein ILUMI_23719 [Ignelater luminosus]|uniref:Uncharacterized protein n=1 Tax=Ignelater luminosus TaxID=2038154 RepID=A0A8K0CBK4_IGNLU|nr:hypothetical protein ILUMI_23719 [Ignelater luminosus]